MDSTPTSIENVLVLRELAGLKRAIANWAKRCEQIPDIGRDADLRFDLPYEYNVESPRRGSVLLLNIDGPLSEFFTPMSHRISRRWRENSMRCCHSAASGTRSLLLG